MLLQKIHLEVRLMHQSQTKMGTLPGPKPGSEFFGSEYLYILFAVSDRVRKHFPLVFQ